MARNSNLWSPIPSGTNIYLNLFQNSYIFSTEIVTNYYKLEKLCLVL